MGFLGFKGLGYRVEILEYDNNNEKFFEQFRINECNLGLGEV